MARITPGITKPYTVDVRLTLQPVDSYLVLENPEKFGFSLGVIAEIDSQFVLHLWDTNDCKVFELLFRDFQEAQVGFIVTFCGEGMEVKKIPSWRDTEPTAELTEKLKEPVYYELVK